MLKLYRKYFTIPPHHPSIAVMIHCCQSRDPLLLQTHSANPFLSTGTCIKRIQFSFSVQVQFSSIRKLFLYEQNLACLLSFILLTP